MNNLIDKAIDLEEKKYENAMNLHCRIMASAQQAATSLIEMCKNLKLMRDQKLYKELGHETFDDYVEQRAGIKARQAYNYIQTYERLPKDVLQLNASLGITKLSLLSQLPEDDIRELTENVELEDKSTREIQKLVDEKKKLTEQLSLFQKESDQSKDEVQALQEQIKQLQEQIDKERSKTTLSPEEIEQQKQEAVKQAVKEAKKAEKDKASKQIDKKAEKQAQEKIKELEQKHKQELEEKEKQTQQQLQTEIDALKRANKESQDRAVNLEKQLKLSDSTAATFKVYFNAIQDDFNKMIDVMSSADDEVKAKFLQATDQLITVMQNKLKED